MIAGRVLLGESLHVMRFICDLTGKRQCFAFVIIIMVSVDSPRFFHFHCQDSESKTFRVRYRYRYRYRYCTGKRAQQTRLQ